jgi:Acyl carrier protein
MTFEKVAKLIAENKDMDVADITMTSTFEDLGLDSLDTVELVMVFEEEFNITIEIEGEELKSVADLVALIDKLIA